MLRKARHHRKEVLSQMPRKTGCGETDKPSRRPSHAENAVKGTGEDPLYRETHTHAGECACCRHAFRQWYSRLIRLPMQDGALCQKAYCQSPVQ